MMLTSEVRHRRDVHHVSPVVVRVIDVLSSMEQNAEVVTKITFVQRFGVRYDLGQAAPSRAIRVHGFLLLELSSFMQP